MQRLVLDTNVIVSGLLSETGPPARILDLWIGGEVSVATDARLEAEYRDVLARPGFRFATGAVAEVLALLDRSERVVALPLPFRLPDRTDEPFLEVAVAAAADALITGNTRHFAPARGKLDLRIVSPREFMDALAAKD